MIIPNRGAIPLAPIRCAARLPRSRGVEFAPDSPLEGEGFEPSVPPVCEIAIKLRAESRRGMSDGGVSLDPPERTMGRRWLAVAGAALVTGASAAQVVVPTAETHPRHALKDACNCGAPGSLPIPR